MRDLKIIIIDNDIDRREKIKEIMPGFAITIALGFGESTNRAILPDEEGNVPDIVIINGDDEKGRGLYTFDWMRTKSGNAAVMAIPVIVLTEDEFSDRCLDFLEIGDVTFCEGDVDEDRIFEIVTDTLHSAEFAMEPVEPAYSETKSYDKVLGLSIKPAGEAGGAKRVVVLDMDTQLANLESALERGREKTEQIKGLLTGALEAKSRQSAEKKGSTPHFLNKIRVEQGLEPIVNEVVDTEARAEHNEEQNKNKYPHENIYMGMEDPLTAGLDNIDYGSSKVKLFEGEVDPLLAGLDDIEMGDIETHVYESGPDDFTGKMQALKAIRNIGAKIKDNPSDAAKVQNIRIGATDKSSESNGPVRRKTIVVIDDEAADREVCDVYLSSKYDLVLLESGEKAIEFFEQNSADMILLDTYMPGLGGVQTLGMIRQLANGQKVPVIYVVDKRYPVYVESLSGENVIGVLQKPINMGGLSMAVDGFFRSHNKK